MSEEAHLDTREMDHVLAFWYVAWQGQDWLAVAFRKKGERRWSLAYRFRYYAGTSDPFDGADRKSWYAGGAEEGVSAAEVIAHVDHVAAELVRASAGKLTRVEVHGDGDAFGRLLLAQPFTHAKVASSE